MLLIVLLCSSLYLNLQVIHAEQWPTLAEVINNVTSKIQTTDAWTCVYNQIFGLSNQSAFDVAITQALSQNDYSDVFFIATLAELNDYSSQIINDCVLQALQNMPMCGSLPVTYNGTEEAFGLLNSTNYPAFCLYDRYMINAYLFAQNLDVSNWNITQAFLDFADAYLKMPIYSQHGEMLWINPELNFAESYSSRYYDEYAETLDMFLLFAEAGVNATVSYDGQKLSPINFADDMWLNMQSLWNGNFYNYNTDEAQTIECEMGNFAQIITEYQNFRGNITDFNRVIQDIEYTLLAENFSSPIWGTVGAVAHYQGSDQLRLRETLGNMIALQMLYPYFNATMQANFQGMLNTAWQGLVNSALYSNSQFSFFNNVPDNSETVFFCDDASSLGAMTLFLDGIVPETGYLAINASNEAYQDYRTCFPTSEWRFNYQNQTIRIPVMAGKISFIFGSLKVTQDFPTNGVYDVQFAYDWNSIVSISEVENISTTTLQPVTLQTITRPTPPPSPTPSSTPQPTPPTTTPTLTPTPAKTSPSNTPIPRPQNDKSVQTSDAILIISACGVVCITSLYYVNVKRKKRKLSGTK